MSDDSWNLPLIVLEALKDILFDFREARTGRQAWRPIQEFLSAWQTMSTRILTHRKFRAARTGGPRPGFRIRGIRGLGADSRGLRMESQSADSRGLAWTRADSRGLARTRD